MVSVGLPRLLLQPDVPDRDAGVDATELVEATSDVRRDRRPIRFIRSDRRRALAIGMRLSSGGDHATHNEEGLQASLTLACSPSSRFRTQLAKPRREFMRGLSRVV